MRRYTTRGCCGRVGSAPPADPCSLARAALAPFHDLLADIDTIAGGDVYHPIAAEGPPELVAIAIATNRMRVSLLNRGSTRSSCDTAAQALGRLSAALRTAARRNPGLAEVLQPLIDEADEAIRAACVEARVHRSP